MVGATAAHAIAIKEIVSDIALIDVAKDMVGGQAFDLDHATAYTHGVQVRVGDYSELKDDDIVVITCGAHGSPGKTRLDLIYTNAGIIRGVIARIKEQSKNVFIIMVSNPVDVLTYIALKESGLPKERVFGVGTMLDTARLRVSIAHQLGLSQFDVQVYMLGEHGDSSFATLSSATIGGIPLNDFPGFDRKMIKNIEEDIRKAAYQIVTAKKSTYYGISHVIAKTVQALLHNAGHIFTTCSLAEGQYDVDDVAIGLPSSVNSNGVKILEGHPLSEGERKQLHDSAKIIRGVIDEVYSKTVA